MPASPSLKQRTARGLLWGGISNGSQQLLNVLFGILLARMLTADDYGLIGELLIFSALAGTLQESGFTLALANRKEVRHEDYNAVFWFSLGVGTLLYLLLFFCAPLIAAFYGQPELVPLSRYLFLGFLISSTGAAQNAYLFRNLMVKQRALAQLPALALSGCVGVGMVWYGYSYWGLATQMLLYITFTNVALWFYSPWRPTLQLNFRPLGELFGFSSKLLLTNLFLQLNNNLLSSMLGKLFTKSDVGYYTQSAKWNTQAFSLINGMIGGVAQPVLAEVSADAGRQRAVFRKMLRFAAFLSFPLMLGLALVAREFIVIAITDRWLACVPLLQMLCVWGAFMPVVTLYTNLLLSGGRSTLYMWNIIAQSLLQLLGLLLIHPYGLHAMVALFVGINVGWLLIWHFFVWRSIGLRLREALTDVLPFCLLALLAMAGAWLLTRSISNLYLLLIAKMAVAALLYVVLMRVSRAAIFRESLQYLRSRNHRQA
ncbi:MAG: lipopolysaccharide biosynthesis protein [Prevotellaceae bacterium]|jgi:O-antigen/teichoic acid export membrane protein|nr:lipopolysaccharide biosynthesis protein [Prevotellaceae bacterium]